MIQKVLFPEQQEWVYGAVLKFQLVFTSHMAATDVRDLLIPLPKAFFFPSKYSLVPKQKYSWNLHPQLCDAGNEEAITWMLHSTASQITSRGEALFIPAGSDPCQLSQDLHIHLDTRKLHWCFTHYLICNWKNPEPSRANHTGVLDCKMTCEC